MTKGQFAEEFKQEAVLAAVPGDFYPIKYLIFNPDIKEAGRDLREYYLDCG